MFKPSAARVTENQAFVFVKTKSGSPMTFVSADLVKAALKRMGVDSDLDVMEAKALVELQTFIAKDPW